MDIANKSRVFDADECMFGTAPDNYLYKNNDRPSEKFVLCRDKDNSSTAVYGQDIWDYNPYRLSAKKINNFRFDLLLKGDFKAERRDLVDEAKYLLFLIQYYAQAGHTGTIAVSTLYGYYQVMKSAVEYCISLNSNQFVGIIALSELFSNKNFLANFLTTKSGTSFQKRTRAIGQHLSYIGQGKVGFSAIAELDIDVGESEQTPVIPTQIYLTFINHLTDDVDMLFGKLDNLPDFLSEFVDPLYGRSHETQKSRGIGGKAQWRADMSQALHCYGLEDTFSDDLVVDSVRSLSSALKGIQYRMRLVLHLYTGMRDQEVMRLPYNCIEQTTISEEGKDNDGKVITESRVIKLISTTTKYTGYRESACWYAAPEAEKAIQVLKVICQGLAKIYGVDVNKCDLFLNPAVVLKPKKDIDIVNFDTHLRKPAWMEILEISEKDFAELQQSSPERDFNETPEFHVGSIWPTRSHQFRRSLAFYASSSGFVKLPTLKRQFKHLTADITRYYSRNFENINTIFGCYNEETKEFDLPSEHFINECQIGANTNIVDLLMYDLLGSSEKLYGKIGGYVERQRDKLRDNEVLIENVRTETSKRVDKGEIYYRDTLLGGCMKQGKCDSFMLGAITECLTCDDASIKENKVDIQIEELKEQLTHFEESTGEYQVLLAELTKLLSYKEQRVTQEEALV